MKRLFILGLVAALVGCGPRLSPPGGFAGAPAAPAAVDRFLQLARDRDYAAMGWIFGTSEGPILERDPVAEVEERMYALATVLEHDSFVAGTGNSVPGRSGEAQRFDVSIRRGVRTLEVPLTVVRGPEGRWFVEQVEVEALTGA